MNLSVLYALLVLISSAQDSRAAECLPGNKHKVTPSAEGGDFAACKAYKNRSCCTASLTQELGKSPIRAVGTFSWTPCGGNLSPACEAFMVKIECFYRCSPNVVFWKNPDYPSAFIRAPLCSNFCDDWFKACQSDLTCGKNWLTDFNFTTQPSTCKIGAICKNMKETYTDARNMCETLWGQSFVYKERKTKHDCLDLDLQGTNQNDLVVEYYFGNKSTATSTAGVRNVAPKYGQYILTAFSGFISVVFISRSAVV